MSSDPNDKRRSSVIERKGLILLGASLVAVISGAIWWYSARSDELVRLARQSAGRGLVDSVLLRVHAEKLNEKPNDQALQRFVGDSLARPIDSYQFLKPNDAPVNLPPTQDAFDAEVLDLYRANPRALAVDDRPPFVDKTEDTPKGSKYFYYEPIRAKSEACITCHSNLAGAADIRLPQLDNGDLMAVVKLTMPDSKARDTLAASHAVLLSLAIVTSTLAVAISAAIVHYGIVKPLCDGRDAAERVADE